MSIVPRSDTQRLLQFCIDVRDQALALVAARLFGTVSRPKAPIEGNLMHNVTNNRLRRSLLAFGAAAFLFSAAVHAAEPPINTLKNSLLGGRTDMAINGYDPVAYFTVGKPVKGQDGLNYEWMGAKWKFSSQANLDLFSASPEKYAPQYGGYCAYGVTQGYLVKVAPEQFTVRDGKLYLNYDADVQAKWLKDPTGYIKDADVKYPALLKK